MAISQQKMLQFLRSNVYANKDAAKTALEGLTKANFTANADGTPIVVRYYVTEGEGESAKTVVKSMLGIIYDKTDGFHVTIFDNADNAQEDLSALQAEVDRIETAAGLAENGEYVASTGAKFVSNAKSIKDAVEKLDAAIKASEVDSADKTVVITPMADGAGTDLSVNVDGLTVVKSATDGKISTAVKIQYVAAEPASEGKEAVPAHIALIDNANKELSTVEVSDLIGNGLLKSGVYNKETGILTLTFVTADDKDDEVVEVNLADMLDIDDVIIGDESKDYLEVTLTPTPKEDDDKENMTLDVKIVKMAEVVLPKPAEGEEGEEGYMPAVEGKTGLVDAADVKKYIDDKTTDLAVTAEGDDYVSASVNALQDNKHVIVETNVQDVTAATGTRGTWSISEVGVASLAGETAPSISGVENTLMDGKQSMEAVKTYVDAMAAAEAAKAQAQNDALEKRIQTATTVADGKYIKAAQTVGQNLTSLDTNLAALSAKTFTDIVGAEGISASTAATTAGTVEVTVKVDALLEAEAVAEKNHANVAGLVLNATGDDAKLDVSFDFGEFTL